MFKKTPSSHEMDKTTLSPTTLIEEHITTCRLEGKSPKTSMSSPGASLSPLEDCLAQ